jgi:hypothetical protein
MFYVEGITVGLLAVVVSYFMLTSRVITNAVVLLWLFIRRPDPNRGLVAVAQTNTMHWALPLLHQPWFYVVAMDVFAATFTVYWVARTSR